MLAFYFRALLLLAAGALVRPLNASSRLLKERVPVPRDWIKREPAPAEHLISLKFGLFQAGFDELERHLYEVSDPAHARYGQHLSKSEVEALVAPHPDALTTVTGWLEEHGIQRSDMQLSAAKDWVTVRIPVALAETMLDTTFHVWEHISGDSTLVRTTSYSFPAHVHPHVEVVQPTTYFNRVRTLRTAALFSDVPSQALSLRNARGKGRIRGSNVTVDPSCNVTITVDCLKELYNFANYTVAAADVNQFGITGYGDSFVNFQDLQSFYADQVPQAVGTTLNVTLVNGGENNQTLSEAGEEASLDVQYGLGITFPTPGIFWSTGGLASAFIPDKEIPTNINEPYEEWAEFVLSQDSVPQTISTSYADDEQTVPIAYARRVCADFAKLGARGVSLLFASGNGGVGDGDSDPATTNCTALDGVTRKFLPLFPASCPFITSVGGTINVPEVAVNFSGGGFSNYFTRPSYQDTVVPAYLESLPPGTFAGLFNSSGRGIPDVAAEAAKYEIFYRGNAIPEEGTSASTVTFAGIISLLNDARLAQGLPPLGFLNPLIYSANVSATFYDITVGNNPGCGTQGFNATVGWDPITGFGTPNFGLLKDIVAPL